MSPRAVQGAVRKTNDAPVLRTATSPVARAAACAAFTLITVVGAAGETFASSWPHESPDHILMLGNSLSRGTNGMLKRLFKHEGRKVKIKLRAPSGWSLNDHLWAKPTPKQLVKKPWDVVVLQERSAGISSSGYDDAAALDGLIDAVGGRTMFMMTWRPRGAPLESYESLKGEPGGNVGYVPVAFEIGAPVAPAGWAFRRAIELDPGRDLWGDEKHPNRHGRYLAACVLYATMTRRSPVGNPYVGGSMTAEDALFYQQIAADVVLVDPSEWNIPAP